MQHLDEGTIHAWLDGELTPPQALTAEEHVTACPECAALVAEARGLIAASTRILTALDDVPSNVIPPKTDTVATELVSPIARRRWYDRRDLRAAAALLFVAGASLVAVRAGRTKSTATFQSVAAVDKPVSIATPNDEVAADSRSEIAQTGKAEAKALSGNTRTEGTASREKKVAVAGPPRVELAPAPSVAQASPTSGTIEGRVTDVQRGEGIAGANIVTGVATTAAAPAFRQIRADSTADMRRSVYEVSPGVQVTLVETPVNVALEKDLSADQPARRKSAVMESAKANAATAAPAPTITQLVNTISWSDANRRYTLSGQLSTSQLEAIKARLIQMRR